jgi:hypothetical protein
MADLMISELGPILAAGVADGDLFVLVDVDDLTMAPSGTDKNLTADELRKLITERANTFTQTQVFADQGDGSLTIAGGTLTGDDKIIITNADAEIRITGGGAIYVFSPTIVAVEVGGLASYAVSETDIALLVDTSSITIDAAGVAIVGTAVTVNGSPIGTGDMTLAGTQTVSGAKTFAHGTLKLGDSDASHAITVQAGNEAADRTVSLPVMGGNRTFNLIEQDQTISGVKTYNSDKLRVVTLGSGAIASESYWAFNSNGAIFRLMPNNIYYVNYADFNISVLQDQWAWNNGGNSYHNSNTGRHHFGSSADAGLRRGNAASTIYLYNGSANGSLELRQLAALIAPTTDATYLSALDNGGAQLFAVNESNSQEQLTGLCKQLASDATNNTATMSNLADLSMTLLAGKKYTGKLVIYFADSVAAEGAKFDFDGGSATMTTIRGHGILTDTTQLLSQQVSALATDFDAPTVTGDAMLVVEFSLVVNAAGTFIPRFAQSSHTSGTLTAYKCSSLELRSAA